jgi:hypothetical protein
MTDKEINPSPEGADLNLQRFNCVNIEMVCLFIFYTNENKIELKTA